MPGRPCSVIPLPKQWTKRVRSAIIHTIPMAQHSLTCARGRAVKSASNERRLRLEIERLRQELNLLQEEMRLKDGRMPSRPSPAVLSAH